ncbi:MAG: aminotransferase class V-fold PLP-dependent enzyme [Bacteroidetes bacterium]|nr:aminotransferase class V-fold PLP-dependent enzyme [Bacteroidota bacterium]
MGLKDLDWTAFRAKFPALQRCTYLNTAGGGPISDRAANAGRAYYDEAEKRADRAWDDWLKRTEDTREQVAILVNGKASHVSFLQNTSLCLNIIARSFEQPTNVVALDKEFPSCTTPWMQAGHRVRFVKTPADGSIYPDDLREALRDSDGVFVLSSVQFANGFKANLEEIGQICHQRSVHFVVDATQSICAYELDVVRDQIDAVVFSGYKLATAGYGIAAMCLRGELAERPPPLVGWRSAETPYLLENDRLHLSTSGIGHEMGHPTFPGIFSLGGALSLFSEVGLQNVSARIDSLIQQLREQLLAMEFEVISSSDPGTMSGIIQLAVENSDGWASALQDRNVWVSSRRGSLRISVHAYNDENDIESLMEAMREIRQDRNALGGA